MVAAIANAHAGRGRRPGSRSLARAIGRAAWLVETRSLDELARAAERAAAAAPRLVVVCGGDGTVSATLTALAAAYGDRPLPRVCLLPGGTMNVIARSLGVRGSVDAAIGRLGDALAGRRAVRVLRRTAIRAQGERVCFLFGVGLLARFLETYNASVRGRRAVGRVLGDAAMGAFTGAGAVERMFAPFEARITVDGRAWEATRWTNVSAGGVAGLGFGFAPYLRAGERPGAFHLIAHSLSPIGALAQLPRIRLGRGMRDVSEDLVSHVVIEADRELVWAADGDLFPAAQRFELRAGPVLDIVVP